MYVCPGMAVPHGKPHIGSVSRLSNASRWVGARVVYHVFSMSLRMFFVFRKGVQRHMGVPYTGVRPCMAVPHKKLHNGSLLHLPNGSLCTDCVPQGLLTLCVALVNIYLLSFNRGDSHAWGFHAKMSCQAWQAPMRFHKLEVCPAF